MQISILDKHEHRYREYCEAVCSIPRLSAYTIQPQEKDTTQGATQDVGIVGTNIFSVHKETLLYFADYNSKFPVMKRAEGLSADDLIRATKVVWSQNLDYQKKLYWI